MVCVILTIFLVCVASLEACPEPLNIHIQNYEGPIILHTANCDNQQLRNHGNQPLCNYGNLYKQHGCCETDCTCVSRQSYSPYAYGGSVATNVGSGCCPVADAKPSIYCVCKKYDGNGYSNSLCEKPGCQNSQSKYSGCC